MARLASHVGPTTARKRVRGVAALAALSLLLASAPADPDYVAGYLIIPVSQQVRRGFNAGFSIYVPAWPLQRYYPGHSFETGLPGTWMFAQYDASAPKHMYSDVEGGLGWWTDTRFPQLAPKFIMGGVGPNFAEIANGPYHGAGSWSDPKGVYGVAQLTPWLLFPPDGLNLKQSVKGEFLGYGYLNLPLLEAKPTTSGKVVPTGGNCWTLFLNAHNFKGPVAFFTPFFWSHFGVTQPGLVGQLLDSRPMDPKMAIQMETHYIACRVANDGKGASYARIAPTSFPLNRDGDSVLVTGSTCYDRSAIWDSVHEWFDGGKPCTGGINPSGAFQRPFEGSGYATWEIRIPGKKGKEEKAPLDWSAFAHATTFDKYSYGYRWDPAEGSRTASLETIPEYYRLGKDAKGAPVWEPIPSASVPKETGLRNLTWRTPVETAQAPYSMPLDSDPTWSKPGPKAGPFKARLGDGTVVTYYWYRFADQPALQHSGLTVAERETLQRRVEMIHRSWGKEREYLAPPRVGKLADIDPALIVHPPKGLEIGYVPIATRQELLNSSLGK
ncbi:MAG: hypothetical protein ACYC96_16495 [Fimbriimonadaceae bacterium]